MEKPYSQWKAMLAIAGASLKAIMRSPQAVFFSLFFPIVLITIFSALSGGNGISLDVAIDKKSDTLNPVYQAIIKSPIFDVAKTDSATLREYIKKGKVTASLLISKSDTGTGQARYDVHLLTSPAGQKDLPVLQAVLREIFNSINAKQHPGEAPYATISQEVMPVERQYRRIDFYLPGMIGFSLIGAAVFGVAFVFFSLRETLVLKRMFATPIKRGYIVLGESLARIAFQMITAVVLVAFGTLVYGFTLSNGWVTFLEMMVVSFLGLLVFMGFGFLISSIAKNQSVIPIYANLFMFPQYFLSGTFFPKGALPQAIQPIIKFLPLTAVNDALRNISFEGSHLSDCWPQLSILLVWGIIIYALNIKFFKWE